ncbi:uncharacterized protein LOC116341212 isoform X2 [Contarinia nasturtii]|uniref:uncharacterized protein LOC116341212 isoform X2 n=1 Tax=Contarinia nasturtii TaxID=265458 RepID=UPI0012D41C41|nr:uncharacterized protein LOC116341212 isoform X2 [Contarinia nasturtii]
MICAKKCVSFLLVIAVVNSVNSLPIEDEIIVSTIIEKMDDAIVELTTEFPILVEIKEVDTTEAPAPAKEKIKALSFILDSLKVVNEKALSFVQTYITDLDIENGEKPVVSLDTPQTDIKKKTIKHPLLHHFLGSDSSDSLQTAFAKYKGALQNIATKVKTIPASIIKHFTGTGPLQDPVENVTSSQGDMSLKPEVQANPETPISETPVKVSVTEVNASNIEAKPEENSDTKPEEKPESEPAKVEARKLGNSDIVAWPNSDTKVSREIVETVKSVVDATKRVNEDAFNLVQVYLSRLSDGVRGIDEISENERSLDSSADEVEQKEAGSGDRQ